MRKLLLHSDEAGSWQPVSDRVMGGLSLAALNTQENRACFSGNLSLANNGGFAAVRCRVDPDLFRVAQGIRLQVQGDGRFYQLRLYTPQLRKGAAYRYGFQSVDGVWQELLIPWYRFTPVYRGRPLPSAPGLEPGNINAVGLMVADKQTGDFQLTVGAFDLYP